MKATDPPIIVEQTFSASAEALWAAITQHSHMTKWFFENIPDFRPEVGFTTQFDVDAGERIFTHDWKIVEVIPNQKIVYDWSYSNYPGTGLVTFEILATNTETSLLRLINIVTEDFPDHIPEFMRESCIGGWTYFIQQRLPAFMETDRE